MKKLEGPNEEILGHAINNDSKSRKNNFNGKKLITSLENNRRNDNQETIELPPKTNKWFYTEFSNPEEENNAYQEMIKEQEQILPMDKLKLYVEYLKNKKIGLSQKYNNLSKKIKDKLSKKDNMDLPGINFSDNPLNLSLEKPKDVYIRYLKLIYDIGLRVGQLESTSDFKIEYEKSSTELFSELILNEYSDLSKEIYKEYLRGYNDGIALYQKIKAEKKQIIVLESELNQEKKYNKILLEQINQKQLEITRLSQDHKVLQKELNNVNKTNYQLSLDIKTKDNQISNLNDDKTDLEKLLEKKHQEIDGLNSTIKKKDSIIQDKDNQIKDKDNQIQDKDKQIKDKDNQIQDKVQSNSR